MRSTIEIARRGQLTIPKELRDQLRIEQGDEYAVRALNGGVLVLTPRGGRANAALDRLRTLLVDEGTSLQEMLDHLRRIREDEAPKGSHDGNQAAPPVG